MPRCYFTARPDGLALTSPYDPGFVGSFKVRVPHSARTWDAARKVWVIDPKHAENVADLCLQVFGERPTIPALSAAPAQSEVRVFRLEYLGQVKEREGGAKTAMGYADGAWSIIAPEAVLRAWFEGATLERPARAGTLYGVLGVPQAATEAEIKQGYRRMARQWHPDANREEGAHEMFLRIREAYNILSDPMLRKRYNAGLLFEERAGGQHQRALAAVEERYRAPLTCGLIVAEALPRLGRWELTRVLQWQDITDGAGRVMVSSWDRDLERIRVEWVQA